VDIFTQTWQPYTTAGVLGVVRWPFAGDTACYSFFKISVVAAEPTDLPKTPNSLLNLCFISKRELPASCCLLKSIR